MVGGGRQQLEKAKVSSVPHLRSKLVFVYRLFHIVDVQNHENFHTLYAVNFESIDLTYSL